MTCCAIRARARRRSPPFATGLAITERLARADPNNAQGQRDVAVSHAKLAGMALTAGNVETARRHLTAGRAISADLVARAPAWVVPQRDLEWFDTSIKALPP